jgi:O-antigen/teichoic acid export membrane protein
MLVTSFAGALNPEVARQEREGNHEGIYSAWVHVIRNLAFVLIPTYALLLVMRREFITGLFTANYAASIPIFAVHLLIVVLTISMHYPILRVFDDLRYFRFKFYVLLLPVTFGALYLGWRTAGLVGVATAMVLTRVLDLLVIVSVVGRRLKLGVRDLGRLAPLLRTAGAALTAALAIGFLRLGLDGAQWVARLAGEMASLVKLKFTGTEWHALIVLGICSIVFVPVYLASAWGLGAVSDAEKAALNRLWAKLRLRRGGVQPVESST